MRWRSFSLRTGFVVFTILSVTTCILAKHAWDNIQSERKRDTLQRELEITRSHLESGKIAFHQPVAEYLRLARPCQVESFGAYTIHDHGFVGGMGHGVTVISKNGRLVKAYGWSCLGGDTYFDGMDQLDETELGRLRSAVHRR